MSQTYHARLHGDRIEWIGEAPPRTSDETPLEIDVRVPLRSKPSRELPDFSEPDPARSRALREYFQSLPADRESCFPSDAVAWQREIRKDRPLPGRSE